MFSLPRTRFKAYSFLLLNTALWGFAAPIIKYSLNFTTPSTFLFYRFVIAAILFFPIYHFSKRHHHHPTNFKLLLTLGLLGTPLTLLPLFYGLQLTSSIEASIIESSSPIFIVLGGMFFLREIIKPREWCGLTVALFGTLVLAIEPLLSNHTTSPISIVGNLLIILSNLIWTAFLLIAKKTKTNPTELSFFSFLISVPFFFLINLSTPEAFNLNTLALPGILYMAIGGSIIAFWAYTEGQKHIEAGEASIFTYLKPAFSIPLSFIWLHETVSPLAVVSTMLIIFGVFVSEKR